MFSESGEQSAAFKVVKNHEEQYSLWPSDREAPAGWRETGQSGTKDECLSYIESVWTDMRPLSVRKRLGAAV